MEDNKSVLDTKPPEILGYTLTANQKIWLYFLLATGFRSAVYMFDLASCIAVVNEHYKAGYIAWGTTTLLLLFFPSAVFFVIIVSRPDLWDEHETIPDTTKWFCYRIAQFFFYPIWVMYRYAKQFFWALDALMQHNEKKREESLQLASQPSQTELYLFLQTFLQAIPQAFLQIYIMLANYQQGEKISQMQTLCITSSLMMVAHKTVSFLWFESQKIVGRKEPWSPKAPVMPQSPEAPDGKINPINKNLQNFGEDAESSTPFLQPRGLPSTDHQPADNFISGEGDNLFTEQSINLPIQTAPARPTTNPEERGEDELHSHPDAEQYISHTTDSPRSHPTYEQTNVVELHEHSQNVTDSVSNITTNPNENTTVDLHDQTDIPHSTLLLTDSNLTRSPPNPEERATVDLVVEPIISKDPTLPRPDSKPVDLPKRKVQQELKGMEEDDALGKCVAFFWWFFFLFSRILAMAACANFQPFVFLGILVVHYVIVTSHLLKRTGFSSIYKVFIQLCLSYVLIFCFIEFRYKLKNVTLIYTSYFALMLVEIVFMSLSWYAYSDLDGFWYKFVFIIIFGSCVISLLSMSMYFAILKPKVKIVVI